MNGNTPWLRLVMEGSASSVALALFHASAKLRSVLDETLMHLLTTPISASVSKIALHLIERNGGLLSDEFLTSLLTPYQYDSSEVELQRYSGIKQHERRWQEVEHCLDRPLGPFQKYTMVVNATQHGDCVQLGRIRFKDINGAIVAY